MKDFQSPRIRSYTSYEGDRNLQLVDPTDLKPVRGIYVVRESKRNYSPMTSDLWRKISYKDLPVRPIKSSSHSTSLKGNHYSKKMNHIIYRLQLDIVFAKFTNNNSSGITYKHIICV